MTDYTRLRGLAEQATPGPWKHENGLIDGPNYAEVITTGPVNCMAYCYGGSSTIEWEREVDAEFIAAANPAVVLDLLDRIATLTAQVSNQASELEDTRAAYALTRHQLDAHRAGQGTWVHEELGGHTEIIHDSTEGITR